MFFKRASANSVAAAWEPEPGTPVMTLRGVEKSFPVGSGSDVRAPPDCPRHQARRVRLDHGAVGRWQVHAAPHPRPARQRLVGRVPADGPGGTHAPGQRNASALQKRHIGFVFQSYHLLDNLTVYENIELPLSYRDVKKSERQSIVADVLDRFGIVAKKDLYPSQLSGGQQQLVGVARAVVARPAVILADEPTGNLHSGQAQEIMELFRHLNQQGTTIVQVTHSETNAAYGNRVIRLRDGFIDPT